MMFLEAFNEGNGFTALTTSINVGTLNIAGEYSEIKWFDCLSHISFQKLWTKMHEKDTILLRNEITLRLKSLTLGKWKYLDKQKVFHQHQKESPTVV